jgi:hypothetical protein
VKAVRCRGCGRVVGYTKGEFHAWVYCTETCSKDFPVSTNEERDSLVELLGQLQWSPARIATALDTSRQRVHQILQQRKVA